MFLNHGRLVGHLYLGSTLTESVSSLARQLSRECGTQARPHSRGSPAGTREARLSRVITQPSRHLSAQVSPMRQTGGGAAVVVRGWESQPHGEGRQDVLFWTTEGFMNREGSR